MCSGSRSLYTDLLFSQMNVEYANENKNYARLMNANVRGWGCVNENIEHFFSRSALAGSFGWSARSADLQRKRDHDFSSFGVYCLPLLSEGK